MKKLYVILSKARARSRAQSNESYAPYTQPFLRLA